VETRLRKWMGAENLTLIPISNRYLGNIFMNLFLKYLLLISISLPLHSQKANEPSSYLWEIDNLSKIGGYPISVFGNPTVKKFPEGTAIVFDGIDDGMIIQGCPINKSSEFTIEIIFKPDSSFPNNVEQRFLHIQKPNFEHRRMLLELRLNEKNGWIVDTHVRADSALLTSLAKEYPHPVDQWYYVAFVYKNGIATHYVNGRKEMSGLIQYIPVDSAHVSLGMRMNQRSFFKGAIKTVRLSNYVLDSMEFMQSSVVSNIGNISKNLMFSDSFDTNNKNWISEFENPSTSNATITNGVMDISASAGATIWFNKKLSGNIIITYDAIVKNDGGPNDRVSDLNAFWMATDPLNKNTFTRNGKFSSYDNMNLYYSGIGGHDNETTRFRKYYNNGDKPVIKEYLDKDHLLQGNRLYRMEIFVNEGHIQLYCNDELYFDFNDTQPYREGYFAFRTTRSHQIMDNFKVFQIVSEKQ